MSQSRNAPPSLAPRSSREGASAETPRWCRALPALLTAASAAMLVSMAVDAVARDRPGTPNKERASVCNNHEGALPAVCVEFHNTAKEPVIFDGEVTINGELTSARPEATCWDQYGRASRGIGWAEGYGGALRECEAAVNFNGRRSEKGAEGRTAKDRRKGALVPALPQGLRFNGLEYNTTYCFRFRARRVSDDVVSAAWSSWACATTRAAPPQKPEKPNPAVEFIPPGRDWRTKPPIVMIRWGAPRGGHSQEISKTVDPSDSRARWNEVKGKLVNVEKPRGYELADTLTENDMKRGTTEVDRPILYYRVCAINVSGKTCSRAVPVTVLAKAEGKRPLPDVNKAPVPVPGTGSVLDKPSDALIKDLPVVRQKPPVEYGGTSLEPNPCGDGMFKGGDGKCYPELD